MALRNVEWYNVHTYGVALLRQFFHAKLQWGPRRGLQAEKPT